MSRRRRKHEPEEENQEFPRAIGNMIVTGRDAVSGYQLVCSCSHPFVWKPGVENSVNLAAKPSGLALPKAMCPVCKSLWFEDAKWVPRRKPVCFAYFGQIPGSEMRMLGLGKAGSFEDAITRTIYDLKLKGLPLSGFKLHTLTDEEYIELEESVNKSNAETVEAAAASLLSHLFGGPSKEPPDDKSG